MKKDVSSFKISVHCSDLMQSFKTIYDLFQKVSGLILSQSFFIFQVFFQITAITVLCDYKYHCWGHECVDKPDNILVFTAFKNFNLSFDEFIQLGSLIYKFFRYSFNGNLAVIPLINCLVDYGPSSFTEYAKKGETLHLVPDHVLFFHFNEIIFKVNHKTHVKKYKSYLYGIVGYKYVLYKSDYVIYYFLFQFKANLLDCFHIVILLV